MEVGINVLMLGARGCGKSTLLASMYYGLKEINSDQLKLRIEDTVDSAEMLTRKERLLNVFARRNGNYWTEPSHTGTKGEYKSVIDATLCKHLTFKLNMIEVPGSEFKESISETTIKTIAQTQVFIIAIDTPWLMEKGRQGIRHNDVQIISELLITIFSESDKNEDKLLLFVPMKCEKYYNSGQISRVNNRIKEVYAELIEHLTQFEYTTIYITPALTLGNLEFDQFVADEKGNEYAQYRYTGEENYAPRYTEQPLIYIMDYLLISLNRNQEIKKPSWWNKIGNAFIATAKSISRTYFN